MSEYEDISRFSIGIILFPNVLSQYGTYESLVPYSGIIFKSLLLNGFGKLDNSLSRAPYMRAFLYEYFNSIPFVSGTEKSLLSKK